MLGCSQPPTNVGLSPVFLTGCDDGRTPTSVPYSHTYYKDKGCSLPAKKSFRVQPTYISSYFITPLTPNDQECTILRAIFKKEDIPGVTFAWMATPPAAAPLHG